MIRKFARLDASPATVRAIFRDVKRWPAWMPTVDEVEVLEQAEDQMLVDIQGRMMGRVMTRRVAIRFDEQGYTERQVSGRLKRWKAVWRFAEPPTGRGTVVSTQIDMELGMLRYVLPKRRIQRTLDEFHEQIVSRAEARARRREILAVPTVWGVQPGETLSIRVYETPTELEVWFGERRFVVPAVE